MRILVTFAVDAEFAPWRKRRKFLLVRATPLGSSDATDIWETSIGETAVSVYLTGIRGRVPLEAMLYREAVYKTKSDLAISSGLAGALREGLNPGDLIAPQKARTLKNDVNVDSEPSFRERAIQQGALPIDNLITVDRIVSTVQEKARLGFLGEAVDMESANIMAQFVEAGLPVLTIRSISDGADEDLPIDFDRCLTPQGEIKPINLMNQIVRRPGNLPNLVRFGRQSHQAAQKLTSFLDSFIATLSAVEEKVVAV
jgi:adenosylhomocysteine nucleosidase